MSVFTYNVVQLQGKTIKETGCFVFTMKIIDNTNKTRYLILAQCKAEKMVTQLLRGMLRSPYPDLLPDVFCLMVRIFRLMLVLFYIYIYIYT